MITDLEVEDFLSHHGVKGQKWGVRNRSQNSHSKQIRNKRIITGVAIGGALAATAIISSILTKKGMTPVNLINSSSSYNRVKYKAQSKSVDIGANMFKKMLAKNSQKHISDLPKRVKLKDIHEFKMRQSRLNSQKLL